MINSLVSYPMFSFWAFMWMFNLSGGTLPSEGTPWKGPPEAKPVKVNINIQVNKLYNINSLDETYQIDGYLVASWQYSSGPKEQILYENQLADRMIGTEIWVPAFEFINVVENRHIGNKQVLITEKGEVLYNERFNATFTIPMDFRVFPFDKQKFSIQLETFSYEKGQVVFTTKNKAGFIEKMADEWTVENSRVFVEDVEYDHLQPESVTFSRYVLQVGVKRKVNRYLWQLILPLLLIIGISWSVFWIPQLSDQLATGFTLMLTLVAFNFNTSSMLPSLPYMTLIESLITIGYISVSIVLIIIIIVGNALIRNYSLEKYDKLLVVCRYAFPIGFLVFLLLLLWIFQNNN